MAIPTSARLSDGASLMPSPTMQVLADPSRLMTVLSLSSGRHSQTTSSMPRVSAILLATWRLSPVSMTVFRPRALRPATVSTEFLFRVSDRTANPTVLPSTPARTTVYPSALALSAAETVSSRLAGHMSLISPSLPAMTTLPSTVPETPRPGM